MRKFDITTSDDEFKGMLLMKIFIMVASIRGCLEYSASSLIVWSSSDVGAINVL